MLTGDPGQLVFPTPQFSSRGENPERFALPQGHAPHPSRVPPCLVCQRDEVLPITTASPPPSSLLFPDPNEALIFSEPAASIPVPSDLVSRLMDGARRASRAAWAIKHHADKSPSSQGRPSQGWGQSCAGQEERGAHLQQESGCSGHLIGDPSPTRAAAATQRDQTA